MSASVPKRQRVVVKVGSSTLTDAGGRLLPSRVALLVDQIAALAAMGHEPVLVSSGAIACGMAKLGFSRRPKAVSEQQACAAVGQNELMHVYAQAFGPCGLITAQVLLTQDDFSDKRRFQNATQTLGTLLKHHVVPIINENDTVAVEEIAFGDNDRLAALVACAVDAHLLVLLSDVDGLLQDGKVIERVEGVGSRHFALVQGGRRETTKGGMTSKLEAARIAGHDGIPMVIANGSRPTVLTDLLAGRPVGTLFTPPRSRLSARKWWIAFSLRTPRGRLRVDAGAARALLEERRSLLASGVVAVEGRFEAGACVAIDDAQGRELARGVTHYGAGDLARIRGLRTAEAAKALGVDRVAEVVHRDELVLAHEMEPGEETEA